MRKLIVSVAVVFAVVAVGGCRKASESLAEKLAEKAIEKDGGGKADVDFKDGKMTIKTKDGEMVAMTGGSATVPANFPKDILVPKGAKIMASFNVPEGASLTMESKESPESLIKEYEQEMKKQGWTEEANMNTGDAVVLIYKKDNNKRTATVMVTKADKGSQLVLTAATEKSESGDTEADGSDQE